MKKLTAIVIALLMVAALAACGNTAAPETTEPADTSETASIANPMTEYASLEELNAALEAKLAHPPVMGVTDEKFFSIDDGEHTIGEYDFAVNGRECTLRFCADYTGDISGVYMGEKTVFQDFEGEGSAKTEDAAFSRWFTLEGQYVLCAKGSDVDDEWFATVCDEMRDLTASGDTEGDLIAFYDSIAGNYQDSVSQRASATVESLGEEGVKIVVTWADSAAAENTWTMTAKKTEDGLLNYNDCEYVKTDYSEDEAGVQTVVYSDGEGFFSPTEEGKLIWNGAADENCTECEFELIPAAD